MKNLIPIFLIVFVFFGCQKKNDTLVPQEETSVSQSWDAAYVGRYKGTWTSQPYSAGVLYALYATDTILTISSYPAVDSTLATTLNNCPTIYYSSHSKSFSIYHGNIEFRNDSMLYFCMNGGLGAGRREIFKGKKL